MIRLFLGFRYLWARPISWISMIGIWVSVTALITTIAIMSGFLKETRRMIRGTAADVVLTPHDDGIDRARLSLPPFATIAHVLEGVPGVLGAAPRFVRPALVRASAADAKLAIDPRSLDENQAVTVIGIDPALERGVTEFDEYLRNPGQAGTPVDDFAQPFRLADVPEQLESERLPIALPGEGAMEFYKLRKGDEITLVTLPETFDGDRVQPLSQRFVVGGSIRTGHFQFDRHSIYVPIAAARAFAESTNEATEICVTAAAKDGPELDAIASRVRSALAEARLPVAAETWIQRNRNLLSSVENQRAILGFILFFFVLVMSFNVFATLTILVSEKTKDIGILNTLGVTPGGILGIFLGGGVLLSAAAAALGAASGVALALNINRINDGIGSLFGVRIFRAEIYTFDRIPIDLAPEFVVLACGGTVALALVCALLPAARAARMDPVQSLRHE